MTKQLVSI